jgi:hypothetical protein
MSLTPSEAYAAAALFALALRESLRDSRASDGSAAALHDNSEGAHGVWLAGGLAQRVFADLGVPSRAWSVRHLAARTTSHCVRCAAHSLLMSQPLANVRSLLVRRAGA